MDKSWKKLFEQKIRSRGKEYSCNNVLEFVADENGYSAIVRGSKRYKVKISADYSKMSCTCPYASDGKNCKHMAAVLYYAENLEYQKKEAEKKLKEKIERQKTRADITNFKKEFGAGFQKELLQGVQSISEWKKEVNGLIKEYKNKEGYIGYWEADDFIYNLLHCFGTLYSYVSLCADKKAVGASVWLYKRIHDVGVDDSSSGCTMLFEEEMLSLWEELAEYSDKNKTLLKTELVDAEYIYTAADKLLDKLNPK